MPNGSPVFAALRDVGFPVLGDIDPAGMLAAAELLAEAGEWFSPQAFTGRGDVIAEEMRAAIGLASIGLRRLAVEREVDVPGRDPTGDEVDAAISAQRAAWLRSSRPGGLDDSLAGIRRSL